MKEQNQKGKTLTGSQIIIEVLKEQNVDTVFGYLGGVVLPLFDELYGTDLNFIIPRHEQGGAHMADAYTRATGKTGVVIATSGPGATNLVTGIANAMVDSIPMVAITGQVRTALIGGDAFQEVDTTGITRPITKYNVIVKDINDLADELRKGFYIASTGRPGPVLIDIPVDVSVATTEFFPPKQINMPGYRLRSEGHNRQLETAAEAINESLKPVLYVGGGVILSNASKELNEFADKANLPVTMTLLGLGAYDQRKSNSLGMLGMHGTAYSNYAVQACDLLIAVGARFDDRVTGALDTFCPNGKILHIDIDPASISKNVFVDIPIVGDAKKILTSLIDLVEYRERKEWFDMIANWKTQFPLTYDRTTDTIKPQAVIEEIYKQAPEDTYITTGVGQHQMWTAQYYKFSKPRHLITSGGLGTMGFGLPAAVGAQVAKPDSLVIDIDGDSSLCMTITELSTAVMYKLPVKVVVLNNGYMGMVRQWQELFYEKRYSQSVLVHPSFAAVAEAMGATGITVNKKEDISSAITKMIETDGPVLVEFMVEPEENVWPMVPSGKSLSDMSGLEILDRLT